MSFRLHIRRHWRAPVVSVVRRNGGTTTGAQQFKVIELLDKRELLLAEGKAQGKNGGSMKPWTQCPCQLPACRQDFLAGVRPATSVIPAVIEKGLSL